MGCNVGSRDATRASTTFDLLGLILKDFSCFLRFAVFETRNWGECTSASKQLSVYGGFKVQTMQRMKEPVCECFNLLTRSFLY